MVFVLEEHCGVVKPAHQILSYPFYPHCLHACASLWKPIVDTTTADSSVKTNVEANVVEQYTSQLQGWFVQTST